MEKLDRLKEYLSQFDKICVAYSGGVDSDLVMNAAQQVLGENAVAIIGDAAFLARKDLEDAKRLAEMAGIKYYIVQPDVFSVEKIKMNDRKRCYYCKKSIMSEIIKEARKLGFSIIADGKNADDGKVYRPGTEAAKELGIVSPLYETEMTKADIRQAAKEMGLETWNKASNSCLATRFPYDTELTKNRLNMVEEAELLIDKKGIPSGRVRVHGDIARIEIPKECFGELVSDEKLVSEIKKIGFPYITLDLEGFRSGSMD
ncbi:pyridinium-3,5-biscarboxylic acid mononucleotide sulfurtransferase [Clostridiales bacterium]|nr:pyridinium-3,5-biscarboxylic acid mononucleotide sulfurtransferase [Clostridiales bacterium]